MLFAVARRPDQCGYASLAGHLSPHCASGLPHPQGHVQGAGPAPRRAADHPKLPPHLSCYVTPPAGASSCHLTVSSLASWQHASLLRPIRMHGLFMPLVLRPSAGAVVTIRAVEMPRVAVPPYSQQSLDRPQPRPHVAPRLLVHMHPTACLHQLHMAL